MAIGCQAGWEHGTLLSVGDFKGIALIELRGFDNAHETAALLATYPYTFSGPMR
jgi:hypothetical protein